MPIPDSLQFKIDHFRKFGRLIAREMDLFGPASWAAVHIGQFNIPERTDPLLAFSTVAAADWLAKLRAAMTAEAARMPPHRDFIATLCGA